MTKNDVYVIVDTPKKAKKLKKLLDMFGESMFTIPNNERDSHNGSDYGWGYGFSNGQWQGFNTKSIAHNGKEFKKVSIKQLRTILAKEHLKEGDYVVCKGESGDLYLFQITSIDGDKLLLDDHYNLSEKRRGNYGGDFNISCFKRYATKEEIELLEGKKELVVGKWYWIEPTSGYLSKTKRNALVYNNGESYSFGFSYEGCYVEDFNIGSCYSQVVKEATPQEVESALIEEAKRRGYKNGVTVSPLAHGYNDNYTLSGDYCNFYEEGNKLFMGCILVFKDGKWAEVIKNDDKFAELKEAHKNGAVIQFRNEITNYEWADCWSNTPSWEIDNEYRIKPEEIKDSDIATIEALHDVLFDNHKYDLNSKLLTNARELCKKLQNIVGGN